VFADNARLDRTRSWSIFELFETNHDAAALETPALRGFWIFEASTAAARSQLEYELGSQLADGDFRGSRDHPCRAAAVGQAVRGSSRKAWRATIQTG